MRALLPRSSSWFLFVFGELGTVWIEVRNQLCFWRVRSVAPRAPADLLPRLLRLEREEAALCGQRFEQTVRDEPMPEIVGVDVVRPIRTAAGPGRPDLGAVDVDKQVALLLCHIVQQQVVEGVSFAVAFVPG